MAIEITFNDQGMAAALEKAPERLAWHLDLKLRRFGEELARAMKRKAPKAFTTLTNSIKVDPDGPLAYRIGPHVAYAWWVENGRPPGGKMPPINALIDWIKVKHLQPFAARMDERDLAFVIGRRMQQRGIKGQPFVTPFATDVMWRQRGDELMAEGMDAWLAELG